jgi:hypothetical protein
MALRRYWIPLEVNPDTQAYQPKKVDVMHDCKIVYEIPTQAIVDMNTTDDEHTQLVAVATQWEDL